MSGSPAHSGHVFFDGDDLLEGIFEWPEAPPESARSDMSAPALLSRHPPVGGVVVAHPHPLYGGTMAQPVVYRIAQSCRARGMTTLRFNFRGVGKSRGSYSGELEYRDIEAAAAFVRGQTGISSSTTAVSPGELPVALAGYSFGSVMAAMAAVGAKARALALVAFVVTWDVFPRSALERLSGFRGPVLAVCGEHDDLAPPREVERVLTGLGLDLTMSTVQTADHFFENAHREVGERVGQFLEAALLGRPASQEG